MAMLSFLLLQLWYENIKHCQICWKSLDMTAVGCTDTEELRCSRLTFMVETATHPVAAWGLQLVPIPVLHFLSAWNVPCCLDWLALCVLLVSGRKIHNLIVKTVTFKKQRFRGILGASSKVRTTFYVSRIACRGERSNNSEIVWKWNCVPNPALLQT